MISHGCCSQICLIQHGHGVVDLSQTSLDDGNVVLHRGSRYKVRYRGKKIASGLLFYTLELVTGEWCSDIDILTLCHNSVKHDINIYGIRHCGGHIDKNEENVFNVEVHLW